jgi:hypothetical protein
MELVYKYLPPERKTFLEDGMLRITQPADLNDPFDCISFFPDIDPVKATVNVLRKMSPPKNVSPAQLANAMGLQLAKAKYSPLAKRELVEVYTKSFLEAVSKDIGIVSLSKLCDSSIMWGHYAASHQGYCLGFERNHNFFKSKDPVLGCLRDVTYIQTRTPCKVLEAERIPKDNLFCKSADWGYEQEVRVIYLLNTGKQQKKTIKSRNNLDIYLKRFPFDAVKEILLGYYAKEDLRTQVCAFAKDNQIPVFKMRLPSSAAFAMERSPCPEV